MRVTKRIRDDYEVLLKDAGEARFFNHAFLTGISARKHFEYPENMMLDQSEAFFALFRTSGNQNYFMIGKILRRAAHKIYRDGKKKSLDYPVNKRFLDSIK